MQNSRAAQTARQPLYSAEERVRRDGTVWTPRDLGSGSITYLSGDMLDPPGGTFDHVVCMDSLIHYEAHDIKDALARLANRTAASIVFTVAPQTPALALLHAAGRAFPRNDRAPAIVPVVPWRLVRLVDGEPILASWEAFEGLRVSRGFYISQAMTMTRRAA